jgi:tRNA (guanosine-2'-O-)-methyltransferase
MSARGWFAIGIEHTKTETNVGTLWRTAHAMGAAFVFTVGRRYKQQSSDTTKAWRQVPLFHFATWDDFAQPYDALLIGVENVGETVPVRAFTHPNRAVYILGAEDHGLSKSAMGRCQQIVTLPGTLCLNVATAGAMVMYDRWTKRGA